MLENVLKSIKNWFLIPDGIITGNYTIKDNSIKLPFILNGQYFRICGSVLNDGLYLLDENGEIRSGDGKETKLSDETFDGAIWCLAIPKAVISLAKDIEDWEAKYGEQIETPYTSESFGGYSYSKPSGLDTSADGSNYGWETAFKSKLNIYRRISEL